MFLKFTINQALYIHFPELVKNLDLKQDILLDHPLPTDLEDPSIIKASDDDVPKYKSDPFALSTVVTSVKQHTTLFQRKSDKALAIELNKWITWSNKPMSFVFLGSIISMICLIMVIILIILYHKLKTDFHVDIKTRLGNSVSKIPKFFSNTFGRFRNSVRSKSRPKVPLTRPPRAIQMKPIKTSHQHRLAKQPPISVQAEINRIETLEAEEQLVGPDNNGFQIPKPPPLPSTSANK